MKVKVNRVFQDIHTNIVYSVGDVFEADENRVDEIMGKDPDLIQILPEEIEAPKKTTRRRRKVTK